MGVVAVTNPYFFPVNYAAPSFVAAGTVDSSGISPNPGLPAGHTTDDILIIMALAEDTGAPSMNTPAGYTLILSQTGGLSPFWRLNVWYKRDGGSESTPSISGTFGGCVARMLCFRGCKATGSPVDASDKSSGSGTSLTFPAITATVNNSMVVNVTGHPGPDASGTAEFSGWTNATLASITEATDNTVSTDSGQALGSAYGVLTDAVSSGQTTATAATSASFGVITFNLIGLPA
jgi:hypothetical protein